MYPLMVKADMSQVPIGWSKAVVAQDVDPMQVTADVTQLPIVRPKAMLWRLGSHAGHGRRAPIACASTRMPAKEIEGSTLLPVT